MGDPDAADVKEAYEVPRKSGQSSRRASGRGIEREGSLPLIKHIAG
jgi:hypothetical protein